MLPIPLPSQISLSISNLVFISALLRGSSPCMSLSSFRPSICPYSRHIVGHSAFFDLKLILFYFNYLLSLSFHRTVIVVVIYNVYCSMSISLLSCLCCTHHPYRTVSYHIAWYHNCVCYHFDVGLAYSNQPPAYSQHSVLQSFWLGM